METHEKHEPEAGDRHSLVLEGSDILKMTDGHWDYTW